MSEYITESQAFHQNSFSVEPPICTTVPQEILNITNQNGDLSDMPCAPLINELLSKEEQGLVLNGNRLLDAAFESNGERKGYTVDPLPVLALDANNNIIEKPYGDNKNTHPSIDAYKNKPMGNYVTSCDHISSNSVTVTGSDVSDIPTSYVIPKLGPHEKAVVGTFVDLMITPGYPYKVRRNGSHDFLFGGKPLTLLSVGQGYGKRLTFYSDDILNNNHYFWSDSNPPDGFALSISLDLKAQYHVTNNRGLTIGWSAITSVSEEQIIDKVRCPENNAVELEVKVEFTCTMLQDDLGCQMTSDMTLQGVAIATKTKGGAVVNKIENVLVPGFGECVFNLD